MASESTWRRPPKWDREARAAGVRRRVFCASLADVFEDRPELEAPRLRLWRLILATPHLDWLVLTKRPDVAARWLEDNVYGPAEFGDWTMTGDGGGVVSNAWIGTSCEDQTRADERIPALLGIPAAIRFLSVEPMLGPIDLSPWLGYWCCGAHRAMDVKCADCGDRTGLHLPHIDWVIAGGEGGYGARPCDLAWIRSIRDQCRAAGVAVFCKQLGANSRGYWLDPDAPGDAICHHSPDGGWNLRDPKGADENEWPDDLKGCREFPAVRERARS